MVACGRSDPRLEPFRRGWRFLGRLAYRKADVVVASSREVAAWLRGWLGREDVVSIPNAVVVPPEGSGGPPPFSLPSGPFVLGLGRLSREKGFDLLLEAFAACLRRDGWSLLLVREGPERSSLQARARKLGLEGSVSMPGTAPNPWPVLRAAAVFARPSPLEGFPNGLLEAMAAGLPCIASDTGSGSAELIESRRNGLLVEREDVPGLTAALQDLLEDSERRAALSAAAREVAGCFSPHRIVGLWEEVLRKAQEERHG
jgi:glycosyltransferase involved in cell wall biosynthesis